MTRTTGYFGFSLLTLMATAFAPGCSSAVSGDSTGSTASEVVTGDPTLFECQVDRDCTAERAAPGCCDNGWKTAVAASQVETWRSVSACARRPICPMYIVNDTRVAECNRGTHTCEMVKPADIECGGFMAPEMQHVCPSELRCTLNRQVPDLPGHCVQTCDASTPCADPSQACTNGVCIPSM